MKRFSLLIPGLFCIAASGCGLFWSQPADFEYTESRLNESEIADRMAQADALYRQPRTVERVVGSLDTCLDSVSRHNRHAALWRAARACVWLAERHPDKASREQYATLGVALGPVSIRLSPDRPEPYYYYALNLGYLSQLEQSGLGRLDLMDENAQKVVALDERFDFAGGHRFLGILYFETKDNFLTALATVDEAFYHLQRACELFPDYGHNQLALAKSFLEVGEYGEAEKRLKKVIDSPVPADESVEHSEWVEAAGVELQGLKLITQAVRLTQAKQYERASTSLQRLLSSERFRGTSSRRKAEELYGELDW